MNKLLLSILLSAISTVTLAQTPGDLDPSFGTNGYLYGDIGTSAEAPYDLVLQPDGKIVAAGYAKNPADDFAVARYNADGTPDNTFGTGGKVITDFGSGANAARTCGILSSGKIVLGGTAQGTLDDFALAMYNTDGTLDTSFGTSGTLLFSISSTYDDIYALAVQPDDKIVVTGYAYFGGNASFATARLNPDGSIDTSFNHTGGVITSFGSSLDAATCVLVQPDGKILVGGSTAAGGNYNFVLVRYTANGGYDSTFNDDGIVITDFDTTNEKINSIALYADGRIIAAGGTSVGFDGEVGLARYLSDGTLDSTFDGDGLFVYHHSTSTDIAADVVLSSDEKIIASIYNFNNPWWTLMRLLPDGSFDNSFGSNGIVEAPDSTSGLAYALAIQPDQKIVVTGYLNTLSQSMFGLARYLTEFNIGVIDWNEGKNSALIYPNPLDEQSTLSFTLNKTENISIQLMSVEGKVLKTFLNHQHLEKGKHEQLISFPENLSEGNYFVVISSENGSATVQVVK